MADGSVYCELEDIGMLVSAQESSAKLGNALALLVDTSTKEISENEIDGNKLTEYLTLLHN